MRYQVPQREQRERPGGEIHLQLGVRKPRLLGFCSIEGFREVWSIGARLRSSGPMPFHFRWQA